jgi:hypothetical protein
MTAKRTATRSGLRSLGVPGQLADEIIALGELGIELPVPTEELVTTTLERCRKTLAAMQASPEPVESAAIAWSPAIAGTLAPSSSSWAQFLGALQASVWEQGLPFAAKHPAESAIMLVDNHAVVDPERWDADPKLTMLRGVYRSAEETLQLAGAKPVSRVVILKDDPRAYDQRDLAVIRRAIVQPVARCTYMVSSHHAGAFRGRSCAIVGNIVFEMSNPADSKSTIVAQSLGAGDWERVSAVRQSVIDLTRSAVCAYQGHELHPRLQWAVGSNDDERLREVLAEVMHSRA